MTFTANVVSDVDATNSTTTTLVSTTLDASISDSVTTITVVSGAAFSDGDTVFIESEYILIGTVSSNTFSSCTRGYLSSTAASHTSGNAAGSVFVGGYVEYTTFGGLSVLIDGAAATAAPGTLSMQFSHDGTTVHRDIIITTDDIALTEPKTLGIIARYFRILYANGAVTTTSTSIQTMRHATQVRLVSRLDQVIYDNEDVSNTRSILAGRDPTGKYRNARVNANAHLEVAITEPLSAFGDLRTTELTPQVEVTFPYNINTDIVTATVTNGATVTTADSMLAVTTGTNSAGDGKMESRKILKYRSGLGGLARFTAMFTTGVANSKQEAGVGNDDDGFFFGYNGAAFGILRLHNGTEEWIPQTSWNVDTMDGGNGDGNPTAMLLDPTKLNVYQIQFQWLGAGQITFYIENSANGIYSPVHAISYANQFALPSIYNPSLPVQVHASNSGNTSSLVVQSSSMAAFVEGKNIVTGPTNSTYNESAGTNPTYFNLRNKSTYPDASGITNRVRIYLRMMSVGNDKNALMRFIIYREATLTGTPSYSNVNSDNSVMEVDTTATYNTGGEIVFQAVVGKDSGQVYLLSDLDILLVPGEVLTIVGIVASGSTTSAALEWQEDF
jgi:hypothetical protein